MSPMQSCPTASSSESSSSGDVLTAATRASNRRPSGSSPAKNAGTAPPRVVTGWVVSGSVKATGRPTSATYSWS